MARQDYNSNLVLLFLNSLIIPVNSRDVIWHLKFYFSKILLKRSVELGTSAQTQKPRHTCCPFHYNRRHRSAFHIQYFLLCCKVWGWSSKHQRFCVTIRVPKSVVGSAQKNSTTFHTFHTLKRNQVQNLQRFQACYSEKLWSKHFIFTKKNNLINTTSSIIRKKKIYCI